MSSVGGRPQGTLLKNFNLYKEVIEKLKLMDDRELRDWFFLEYSDGSIGVVRVREGVLGRIRNE